MIINHKTPDVSKFIDNRKLSDRYRKGQVQGEDLAIEMTNLAGGPTFVDSINELLAPAGLDFPTVSTPNHRVEISHALGAAGGAVLLSSNELITLAKPYANSTIGHMDFRYMKSFKSDDLKIHSVYYVRAKYDGDAIVPYVTEGHDNDSTPPQLLGDEYGVNGGFDSTKFDVLLGKVYTSGAGQSASIRHFANAKTMAISFDLVHKVDESWKDWSGVNKFKIMMGRTPKFYINLTAYSINNLDMGDGSYTTQSKEVAMADVRVAPSREIAISEYILSADVEGIVGRIGYTMTAIAI